MVSDEQASVAQAEEESPAPSHLDIPGAMSSSEPMPAGEERRAHRNPSEAGWAELWGDGAAVSSRACQKYAPQAPAPVSGTFYHAGRSEGSQPKPDPGGTLFTAARPWPCWGLSHTRLECWAPVRDQSPLSPQTEGSQLGGGGALGFPGDTGHV